MAESTALIQRPDYLRKLEAYRDADLIKIVTGVRRCGKSTLLRVFAGRLQKLGVPDANLLFLNLEVLRSTVSATQKRCTSTC